MSYFKLDFNVIAKSKELTSTQKEITKKIHFLSQEKGYCWASNQFFADELGMSASGINKVITRLEKLGFLERIIIRDERKMVVERKLKLSKKFIETFAEKVTETIGTKLNNIVSAKNQKKSDTKFASTKKNKEQEIKSELNISNEVKKVLEEKLNLVADEVVEELEMEYGALKLLECIQHAAYVANKNKISIRSTGYLKEIFANGFKSKIKRVEKVSAGNFELNEKGLLVSVYSSNQNKEQILSDEDLAKVERMKQLQEQYLATKNNL